MQIVANKRIVLGISGGIAAYKVVQLARNLTLAGAVVDVVMTEEATKFIAPLTFQALTRRPVHTNMWGLLAETEISHVSLGDRADLIVVAPATAHTIARIAAGLSDDLITTTILATRAPILLAPAMNVNMWASAATVENVATLRRRGIQVMEPGEGRMAELMSGAGRLPEIPEIEAEIAAVLGKIHGPLRGWRVLVTAGGTHEALDPVRFIGNHSSGLMGYALAAAARDLGAEVTVISGPATAPLPAAVKLIHVESAAQMHEAVHAAIDASDLLIMAAAVADYQPIAVADHKIKKTTAEQLTITLVRTPDILASLADRTDLIKVGFAAETHELERYALDKLRRKQLDVIVANDARSALGAPDNAATLYSTTGEPIILERQPKSALAYRILEAIVQQWPHPKAHRSSTDDESQSEMDSNTHE